MNSIKHAPRSGFLRHNSIFFFGAAAVGALNYLYYPVMGRLLDTVAFGEVQTLISIFLQITIFLTALGLVAINVVTNYTSDELRNAVVLEFEKLALLVGVGLFVLTLLFGGAVTAFLHFDSIVPFALLMLALLTSVPLTFRGAYLRGKRKFGRASMVNIASATGKLLFAVLLVAAGLGTVGAIGGLVIAQLAACVLVVVWAARLGLRPHRSRWLKTPDWRLLRPELRYGLLVLVGSLLITLQYSIDIIVVKHYFDPATAGLYAGVASVARIIFFLTASIAMVLLSLVKLHEPHAQNRKVLIKSLALTAAVGLPVLVLCVWQPSAITTLLMGQSYQSIAALLLPRLAAAVFVVSILNVFVSYYLALRQYMIAPVLAVGALTTYVLLYAHHASLIDIVNGLLIGSLVMLATLILWIGSRQAKELIWQKS